MIPPANQHISELYVKRVNSITFDANMNPEAADSLNVKSNSNFLTCLKKIGEKEAFIVKERPMFSIKVIKVNERGRKQSRAIILTNHAIYNFAVGKYKYSQLKRRILVIKVGCIYINTKSNNKEFVLQVCGEYDYRFESERRMEFISSVRKIYHSLTGKSLKCVQLQTSDHIQSVFTKKASARDVHIPGLSIKRKKTFFDVDEDDMYAKDIVDDRSRTVSLGGQSPRKAKELENYSSWKTKGKGSSRRRRNRRKMSVIDGRVVVEYEEDKNDARPEAAAVSARDGVFNDQSVDGIEAIGAENTHSRASLFLKNDAPGKRKSMFVSNPAADDDADPSKPSTGGLSKKSSMESIGLEEMLEDDVKGLLQILKAFHMVGKGGSRIMAMAIEHITPQYGDHVAVTSRAILKWFFTWLNNNEFATSILTCIKNDEVLQEVILDSIITGIYDDDDVARYWAYKGFWKLLERYRSVDLLLGSTQNSEASFVRTVRDRHEATEVFEEMDYFAFLELLAGDMVVPSLENDTEIRGAGKPIEAFGAKINNVWILPLILGSVTNASAGLRCQILKDINFLLLAPNNGPYNARCVRQRKGWSAWGLQVLSDFPMDDCAIEGSSPKETKDARMCALNFYNIILCNSLFDQRATKNSGNTTASLIKNVLKIVKKFVGAWTVHSIDFSRILLTGFFDRVKKSKNLVLFANDYEADEWDELFAIINTTRHFMFYMPAQQDLGHVYATPEQRRTRRLLSRQSRVFESQEQKDRQAGIHSNQYTLVCDDLDLVKLCLEVFDKLGVEDVESPSIGDDNFSQKARDRRKTALEVRRDLKRIYELFEEINGHVCHLKSADGQIISVDERERVMVSVLDSVSAYLKFQNRGMMSFLRKGTRRRTFDTIKSDLARAATKQIIRARQESLGERSGKMQGEKLAPEADGNDSHTIVVAAGSSCFACGVVFVDKEPVHTHTTKDGDVLYFCKKDYMELYASKCSACHEPIDDDGIQVGGGKKYHMGCFSCSVCDTPFNDGEYYQDEFMVYCAEHYFEACGTVCTACGNYIKDTIVSDSGGGTWHPECFSCTACKKSLAGLQYYTKNGRFYCTEDYTQRFCPTCAGCNKPIIGESFTANKNTYHHECMKCSKCGKSLVKETNEIFVNGDGDIFCKEDFEKFLAVTCSYCKLPIVNETILKANSKAYHSACFKCDACFQRLPEKFYSVGDNKFCKGCHVDLFSHFCAGCGERIDDSVSAPRVVGQKTWHDQHLKCGLCDKKFELGESMFSDNGILMCRNDYYLLHAEICTGCFEPIAEGQSFSRIEGRAFHKEHVKCFVCSTQLTEKIYQFKGWPICEKHAATLDTCVTEELLQQIGEREEKLLAIETHREDLRNRAAEASKILADTDASIAEQETERNDRMELIKNGKWTEYQHCMRIQNLEGTRNPAEEASDTLESPAAATEPLVEGLTNLQFEGDTPELAPPPPQADVSVAPPETE